MNDSFSLFQYCSSTWDQQLSICAADRNAGSTRCITHENTKHKYSQQLIYSVFHLVSFQVSLLYQFYDEKLHVFKQLFLPLLK